MRIRTKQKISNAVVIIINFMGFAFLGVIVGIMSAGKDDIGLLLNMAAFLVFAVIAFYLHVIIHETGHLVFGLASGYSFSSFRILNMMWQKEENGQIRFCRFTLDGTAGQCLMKPPELKENRMPYFLYNIGGITANALLVALAAGVMCIKPGDIAQILFSELVVMGIVMVLTNGLPLPGLTNDGRNTLELSHSEEAQRVMNMQLNYVIMMKKGIRAKDCPEKWFVMPDKEALKHSFSALPAVFVCDRLLDEGKYDECKNTIDYLISEDIALMPVQREVLRADALFCELVGNRDENEIKKYMDPQLKRVFKTMRIYPSIIRTQYTYELLINNDANAAGRLLDLFDRIASKYPYRSEIEAERERFQLVGSIYQKA